MNIEKEFDQFFEFPGDNRSTVSSVSARLFAQHCVDKYMAENNDLTIAYMSGAASRYDEVRELVRERDELKKQVPPIENGKNRYGLDVSYFRNLINRELNRTLTDYKSDELARVCLRMAMAADDTVINEREFTSRMNLADHDAELIEKIRDKWVVIFFARQNECHTQDEIIDALDHEIDQLRQKSKEAK